MRSFADHNPAAVAVYFLAVAGICMFSMEPVVLMLSLGGALICGLCLRALGSWKTQISLLAVFALAALINPLVSHHGVTVLFVMNHNPVTLEALIYGAAASGMVLAVLWWFRAFTRIMTSDKLLYIFGRLSPKLALMLSMALRYVPLFGRQARLVSQHQKALGLYKEDNLIDSIRGGMRVFSVMVTWVLENGVITADSMTARGYGVGRRSQYAIFRWTAGDTLMVIGTLLLAAVTLLGLADHSFAYYPSIVSKPYSVRAMMGFAAYGLLTLLPVIIQGKEAVRWQYLKSRI